MAQTYSSLTLEYVRVKVTGTKLGVAVDPTVDVVQIAFPLLGVDPLSGDWLTGVWETTNTGLHYARVKIGPGGGQITLAKGRYDVWVKILDSSETPVIKVAPIVIT